MEYNSQYCDEIAKKLSMHKLEECKYFPQYFTIETCNNCNARCIMCPKGQKGTSSLQIMNDEVFGRIVNNLIPYVDWVKMICLNSDGEPLLDKKLAGRIRILKTIGIRHVNISTNAQLLTEERIGELLESGLDDIRISIDGFSKATFESVRRGLDYDTVYENTRNLIRIRNQKNKETSIRIRMVELKENEGERNEWMEYWNSLIDENIDKVQVMPMHSWSGKVKDEEREKIEFYPNKPCISVFSSFTINYNGEVQLCDSDIEQEMVMGNVVSESIEEIWRGEQFEKIREWHANGQRNKILICNGCDHWSRDFKEK